MTASVRDKIRSEIMATGWDELVPHFARGALLLIDATLDLLDVAEAIARDDRPQVERWLTEGSLRRAGDADAKVFVDAPSTRFQLVILQPWVLAQRLPERPAVSH